MSKNKLEISQLDFDSIKTNLKNFLRSQKEFQDYDFEGSSLSVLLDILAYNTHYNAYYLNMMANESFLDTAILRDSIVSHAKTLNYTPYSRKASRAIIDFYIDGNVTEDSVLTLPRGFSFKSESIDNVVYNFTLVEDAETIKINDQFYFNNLEIYEGEIVQNRFVLNEGSNPKAIFTLPNKDIDTSTIRVTVQPSASNSYIETFNIVNDVLDVTDDSKVFFLQEFRNEQYQIYFGDGVIGKKLDDQSIITVSYLVTSGPNANKLSQFVPVYDYNSGVVTTISSSAGGSEKQTTDEIKLSAINQFSTQNRLVTIKDYETYLKKNVPVIDSLSVWGGEDEMPPVFGKVFISMKPKKDYYISETEKQNIIENIIKPKAMMTVQTEIRDPEYLYLRLLTRVKYDRKKTNLSQNNLKANIRDVILNYRNNFLNTFKSSFVISKLQEYINQADSNAIIGSEIKIRLEKRFKPFLNQIRSYKINFKTSLVRGTLQNRLISSEFRIIDNIGVARTAILEEIPESSTGISTILVTNPGYNYTTEPKVTIVGDGIGALAKAKLVNGKIQSIEITNRGINYTKAIVKIEGGEGYGAEAITVLDSRYGTLRTVYFIENAQRQIINSNAGTIDYDTGEINITNLKVLSVSTEDGFIRLNIESTRSILESEKNSIITIDETDSGSIDIQLVE